MSLLFCLSGAPSSNLEYSYPTDILHEHQLSTFTNNPAMNAPWKGIFPAVTTKFTEEDTLDFGRHASQL